MSADASGDLARVAAGLRSEMRSKVNNLRLQLTQELQRIDTTAEKRAGENAARLEATDAELAEFRRQVQRRLRDSARRVDRLAGEIQQVEGLLRRQQGQLPADLDSVPPQLRSLVADARAAERLRSTVMDEAARALRHEQIKRCEQVELELAETWQRALGVSRTLAVRKAGGWAFRRAATEYRTERARMTRQEAALATARAKRETAEEELRHDAAQQQAYRDHPGAAVKDRLTAHLRERVEAAVADYELFPPWFTTVLGHRPAPNRAAEWRDVAVQVVLYRITHEVTDPVVALGPAPQGGPRAAQHESVQAALRRLDEEPDW